jgi:hypothetical protein
MKIRFLGALVIIDSLNFIVKQFSFFSSCLGESTSVAAILFFPYHKGFFVMRMELFRIEFSKSCEYYVLFKSKKKNLFFFQFPILDENFSSIHTSNGKFFACPLAIERKKKKRSIMSAIFELENRSDAIIYLKYFNLVGQLERQGTLAPELTDATDVLYTTIRGWICKLSCVGTAPWCSGKCPPGQVQIAEWHPGGMWKPKEGKKTPQSTVDCGKFCNFGNKAICCQLTESFSHHIDKPGKYYFDGNNIVGPNI